MAILDWEGFGQETTITLSGWFNTTNLPGVNGAGSGPLGIGRSATTGPSNFAWGRIGAFATTNEVWFNGWFFIPGWNIDLIAFTLSGNWQCQAYLNSTGYIQIVRGGTTHAVSTRQVTLNAWHFVQVRALCTNTGSMEVWIDGELYCSASGVDMQNEASPGCNGWAIGGRSTSVAHLLFYSTAGDLPTSRTPETFCYTDMPNGAGATTGFTASAGANWQCTDEIPNNGDTDYVSAASAGLEDTYAMASAAPSTVVVYGVAVEAVARKDDAGTNDLDLLLRSGGTNYASGTTLALSTSYQRLKRLWNKDPATAANWTLANANATQAGVKRTA